VPLLETGVFPRLTVRLVQVGEESGQLDAMLLQVADMYDEEVKRTLTRALALLVPVVTIGLGLVVAGIVASMLSAMLGTYDLSF
jgi:general secretion pathway protein F